MTSGRPGPQRRQDRRHGNFYGTTILGSDMLYKANPEEGSPAPLEGEAHPEDTARAIEAIRDLIYREEGMAEVGMEAEQETPVAKPASTHRPKSCVRTEQAPALKQRGKGFQPDFRLSMTILVLAIFIWKPLLLPGLTLLLIALVAIVYFTVGPDAIADRVAPWHYQMHRRNPDRAARWRARANRVSARLERWAKRLPRRWTDGLYFPSFEWEDETNQTASDPFERLVPQERL